MLINFAVAATTTVTAALYSVGFRCVFMYAYMSAFCVCMRVARRVVSFISTGVFGQIGANERASDFSIPYAAKLNFILNRTQDGDNSVETK